MLEVTKLEVSILDSKRMMIRNEQSKGRKDRYTTFSEKPLITLTKDFLVNVM